MHHTYTEHMTKVSTSITLDPELKKAVVPLLAELGLDLSTAVTIFLKQTLREQAIPFKVGVEIPNPETRAALAEYQMMCENKTAYKRYSSFSDVMKDCENEE